MITIVKLAVGLLFTLVLSLSPWPSSYAGGEAFAQAKKKNCACLSKCGGGNSQPFCMRCRATCGG
jgi:hypothetical protein